MSPIARIETLPDQAPDQDRIDRVRSALSEGALVALPTETVYGIAARADNAGALERLREAKGRPAQLALTWHAGGPQALEQFPLVSPLARRLVRRYWPGPLTLVLPGVPPKLELAARAGWTGLRVPAHKGTAGILAALDFPVVMTSANRHGEDPLVNAAAIEARFGAALEMVLDGGRSRLGEASSVLRLGPGHFELLRSGLHTLEQLRSIAGLRIAFVCTGNTCRSPMAEGLARKLLAERLSVRTDELGDFGFELRSMGVFASVGQPASKPALAVMKEEGVDIASHRARAAQAEDVSHFERVYCMTANHLHALAATLPPGKDKQLELLDPAGRDVPDPMGGDKDDYRNAALQIERALRVRLDDWA